MKGSDSPTTKPGVLQQKLPLSWDEGRPQPSVPSGAPSPASPVDNGTVVSTPEPQAGMLASPVPPPTTASPEVEPAQPTVPVPPPSGPDAAGDPEQITPVVPADRGPASLGHVLLSARTTRGASVAEVAQRTKIPTRIIEQLESDQAEQLPQDFYTRSHLIKLSREYGLDHLEILREYDRIIGRIPSAPVQDSDTGTAPDRPSEPDTGVLSKAQAGNRVAAPSSTIARSRLRPILFAALAAVGLFLCVMAIRSRLREHPPQPAESVTGGVANVTPAIRLDEFIVPQQLPLKELPIPEN